MPKSNLIAAVEKISERIARKVLRECKAFGTMGTWIKTLQDDNRMLKRRVKELEIRVKKLNTYGPTPPDKIKQKRGTRGADRASPPARKRKMTPAQIRKIRTKHCFSQPQIALLLGIKTSRYSNWEYGDSAIPSEFEEKLRELQELKASELRSRMHEAGIFQPNGRPASPKNKKAASNSNQEKGNKTENKSVPDIPAESGRVTTYLQPAQLKEIRQELGLTQRQLALLLGIKSNRYGHWECGVSKAAPEFIRKILGLRDMPEFELQNIIHDAETKILKANKTKGKKTNRRARKK